jgi:hypothetical protein
MALKLRCALGVTAAVVGFAVGGAGPAAAFGAPAVIWVKAGVTPREAQAVYDACIQDSLQIKSSESVRVARRGPVIVQVPANASSRVRLQAGAAAGAGGMAAGLLIYAIQQSAAVNDLRAKAVPHCLHAKGFHKFALTPKEESDQRRMESPQKQAAWLESVYARPDFAQRVEQASRPPSRLPAASDDAPPSTVFGSLQFDPAKLTAAPGVVKGNGAVLSGPVGHWRTAKLKSDAYLPGVQGGVLHAGAPFQLASLDQTPYWCTAAATETHLCLRMEGDYYVALAAGGTPWWANAPKPNALESGEIDESDVTLVEGADDAVGPVDFGLEIRSLSNKSVSLVAVGKRGAEQHEFWRNDLDFNDKGEASLGLWNYRLVLTRSGGGVTARYGPKTPAAPPAPKAP